MITAICSSLYSIVNLLLTNFDFPVICLQFPGLISVYLAFYIGKVVQGKDYSRRKILDTFFDRYFLHPVNLIHLVLRAINFFLSGWLIFLTSYYSKRAAVNPGLMHACITTQVVFTAAMDFIFYKERPNMKGILGITIILMGIIWLCLAKNDVSNDIVLDISEAEQIYCKYMGMFCQFVHAFTIALRVI